MKDNINTDENVKQDFDLLIATSLDIGNKLAGQKITTENNSIHYAEGLGLKIINHILTSRYLIDGYRLQLDQKIYEGRIDFSSILILTRAALETYITFHSIFIESNNEDERQFRFTCWDLGGYMDRKDFQPTEDEHISIQENEKLAIEQLTKELNENKLFKELSTKNKERVLNGQWRMDKSWLDLAIKAGFRKEFFKSQYKFLCGHSHSSRLSIMQVQQNKRIDEQNEMTKASMGILMVVLAKFMYDYINLLPQLKEVKNDMDKYKSILVWKAVGEKI